MAFSSLDLDVLLPHLTPLPTTATTMISVRTTFITLADAKQAITVALLDAYLSYKVYKSDAGCYILKCRDETCAFHVRAVYSTKDEHAMLTVYKPHECGAHIHSEFAGNKSVKILKEHHRAAILVNTTITPSKYLLF